MLVTVALIATGFVTTNGSRSTFLLGRDTAIPVLDRLFLDSRLSFGYFDEFESYVDGKPGFPDERAGSNDSHEEPPEDRALVKGLVVRVDVAASEEEVVQGDGPEGGVFPRGSLLSCA